MASLETPQDLVAAARRRPAAWLASHRSSGTQAARTHSAARNPARAARTRPSAPRAFLTPVERRNRVWQFDFSEFETQGGGTWNLGGLVDYAGKLALACPITATKTHRDAIAALEAARDRVTDLLGRTLAEDCVDPATGELVPLIVVTTTAPASRPPEFARHLRSRPELRHVRTRVNSPQTNGQIERFFGAIKYEHLYRRDIADGQASPNTSTATSTSTTQSARTKRSPSAGRSTPTSPHSQRVSTSRFLDAGH